ncbi:MAG: winged helix DNA-binding domain-containing protein [Candidatus Dormibacteraeota bacterium]|nr:winged helix DNA-binding domain-containing protein [Candidatus Dormibacteraeota bacterium]
MSRRVTPPRLLRRRLRNQQLEPPLAGTPEEVVRSLVAVQAQDYAGAAWAVGQRMRNGTRDEVDQALDEGRILRTHVLRPTWHLVTPKDIGWLLALTGARVREANRSYVRRLGLGDELLDRGCDVIVSVLREGTHLTREQVREALADHGITFGGVGHLHALMDAELRGLVVSGRRSGRQQTYALREERAPTALAMDRPAALRLLATRYLAGHGPATIMDFAWWSGLRVAEARTAFELAAPAEAEDLDTPVAYWEAARGNDLDVERTVHLLPNFDEYTVAYTDRSHLLGEAWASVPEGPMRALQNVVLWRGVTVGTWKATVRGGAGSIAVRLDQPLPPAARRALHEQLERYGTFAGARLMASIISP